MTFFQGWTGLFSEVCKASEERAAFIAAAQAHERGEMRSLGS